MDLGEEIVIKKYIKDHDIVFDVGANVGIWSECVLKHRPGAKIFAFEPTQENFDIISKKSYQKKFKSYKFAMGQNESTVDFCFYPNNTGLSTKYRRFTAEKLHGEGEPICTKVIQTTIDMFAKRNNLNKINFIKIDVEGAELDVFKGAVDCLEYNIIDYIQFEYGGTYIDANIKLKDIVDFMAIYPYKLYKITNYGLVPVFEIKEDYIYCNFLYDNLETKSKRKA